MTIKSMSKDTIIAVFENSKFDFYLTGSRFFGVETRCSDIDFFVSATGKHLNELKEFLRSWGFRDMSEFMPYGDDVIMRAQGITHVYYSTLYNCHVQIVQDAEKKYQIQNILLENRVFKALEILAADKSDDALLKKDMAKLIWLSIYKALGLE